MNAWDAAIYFFLVSVLQILIVPAAPAAEFIWVANPRLSISRLYGAIFKIALFSGLLSTAILASFEFQQGHANVWALLLIVGNILYSNILLMTHSKYRDLRTYAKILLSGQLIAILAKSAVFLTHSEALAFPVITCEWFVIPALIFLFVQKPSGILLPPLRRTSRHIKSVLVNMGSVIGMAAANRIVIIVAGLVLSADVYKVFGLAMQILNSAFILAAAVTAAINYQLMKLKNTAGTGQFLLRIYAGGILVWGAYVVLITLFGQYICSLLFGSIGVSVYDALMSGIVYTLSIIITAINVSVAVVYRKVVKFSTGLLVVAVVSSLAFFVTDGDVTVKIRVWSLLQTFGTFCLIYVVWPKRSIRMA